MQYNQRGIPMRRYILTTGSKVPDDDTVRFVMFLLDPGSGVLRPFEIPTTWRTFIGGALPARLPRPRELCELLVASGGRSYGPAAGCFVARTGAAAETPFRAEARTG